MKLPTKSYPYKNTYPLKNDIRYLIRCGYAAMLGKMVHFEKESLEPQYKDDELSSFPWLNCQENYWANRLIWC